MTPPADGLPSNYRFADLTLDVVRRCVTRQGQTIELKALDFDLLRFLVEHAPNVVNADVLAEKVWGRHFVSPENVAQRVMLLRQSLSDDANKPRYIETVRNKGYRLIPVVERLQTEEPRLVLRRRWLGAATGAALLAVVGAAVGTAYWLAGSAPRPPPSPTSIAVLPFENLSPDPDDAYFAAGMQDVIVSQLTKIGGLRVIPVRPGPDGQRVAPELGRDVGTVLNGSVYYSQGRVRVTPRLTDPATGVARWSNSYERDRSDIFAIQSEIAVDVAGALRFELSPIERERIEQVPTTNAQARDLYLMARARNPFSPQEVLMATGEIEEALALDPEFKEGWVLYARIHASAQTTDPERLAEHRLVGEQAARRAVALDPDLGDAFHVLGGTLQTKGDWIGAEAAYRRAASLNVPTADMGSYAMLQLYVGKFSPFALDIFERGRAAAPQIETMHRFLAFIHAGRGEWTRASELYDLGIRRFAGDDTTVSKMVTQKMHWLVARNELGKARAIRIADPLNAAMLESLDDPQLALAELQHAYAASTYGNTNRRRDIALWAGHFGDARLAFDALRAAVDEYSAQMAYAWMPQLAQTRELPEFKAYMREIGMVAYWEEYGWPPFCQKIDNHDFECH
jgi:TolB-like protein/DNA-binding winged helix-turn-helix (wHTH) protein